MLHNQNNLCLISDLIFQVFYSSTDNDLKSLYLFVFQSELLNIKKNSETKWSFWIKPAQIISSVPRLWREDFLKIFFHQKFSEFFMDMFKMQKSVYETSVITALYRTRQVALSESLYGFTTKNLYIFIRRTFGDNDLQNKAGAFFTVFHELTHYLRRCRCENLGESINIHTPNSSLGLSEGGLIAEKLMFGGHVGFISETGAEYMFNDIENLNLEILKSFLVIGELQTRPSQKGVILKRSRFLKQSCFF